MHTFFINTSKKKDDDHKVYNDILQIQHETRRLISLDYPIADWQRVHEDCVRTMGEMIDSYRDINNTFNLIIFVDLHEFDAYTSIPYDREHDAERVLAHDVMEMLIRRYMHETLWKKLDDYGRRPQQMLVIFEQSRRLRNLDINKNTPDWTAKVRAKTLELLGLPTMDKLNALAKAELTEGGGGVDVLEEKIAGSLSRGLIGGIYEACAEQTRIWVEEINSARRVESASNGFADSLFEFDRNDCQVESVSFDTNRNAVANSKPERRKRDLCICFYLLDCVLTGTVYRKVERDDQTVYELKTFSEIDWNLVARQLREKHDSYETELRKLQRLSDSYSEIGLAPELYAFDTARFGLDRFGNRGKVNKIVTVKEEPKNDKKSDKKKEKEKNKAETEDKHTDPKSAEGEKQVPVRSNADRKELVIEEAVVPKQLEAYEYFAESETVKVPKFEPKMALSELEKAAADLSAQHTSFLNAIEWHASNRLARYAGRSSKNDPPMLPRRKVSFDRDDFEEEQVEYQYTMPADPNDKSKGFKQEEQETATVEKFVANAYSTLLLEYLRFCAGRSVAVTGITENCNWFVNRVSQIKESLKKLKMVALGFFAAMLLVFAPFVVIQWETIFASPLAMSIAIGSFAVPTLVLYVIFAAMSAKQRGEIKKTWDTYVERSNAVMQENIEAVTKFDALLASYIPTLRWVYEYKLDVEFYQNCYDMAVAKTSRHKEWLKERGEAVYNILEDLELDEAYDPYAGDVEPRKTKGAFTGDQEQDEAKKIDYSKSFCIGQNREFYSIIDSNMLQKIIHTEN